MIHQDVRFTLGSQPGYAALMVRLATDNRRLYRMLQDIVLAADVAAQGGRSVEHAGQTHVVLRVEDWQALRRAMVLAMEPQPDQRAPMN